MDSSIFEVWHVYFENRFISPKIKNRMANSKHPDGKAHYEPFHLDLHCLQTYLIWSAELETVNTDHTCTTIVILFFIHLFFFFFTF